MAPSPEGNDVAARRAKKRELDRRSQRAARERTRTRIAHLEATVQAMAQQESSGTIASLMDQLVETRRQRDDLSRLVSSIETSVHVHREAERIAAKGFEQPRPSESNTHGEQWPGIDASSLLQTQDLPMEMLSPSAIMDLTPLPSGDIFGLPTADFLDHIPSPEADPLRHGELAELEAPRVPEFVIVPEPDKPCDCTSPGVLPGRPSSSNHSIWRTANEALSSPGLLPVQTLRHEDGLGEDIPVQVILEGWDAVEGARNVPPLWRKLRRTDELQFSSCGKVERLAILLLMHTLLRYQAEPTADQYAKLPPWYLSRPSQSLPHSSAIDFFVWPGVRERFVFSQHLYCSDFFWKVFADNFRLLWPFELRDCYRRNLRTGLYSISPAFSERIRDIQAWAMAPDFFVHFPDITRIFLIQRNRNSTAMAAQQAPDGLRTRQSDEESGNYQVEEKFEGSAHVEDAEKKDIAAVSTHGLSPEEQKKVIRRIDVRLLPILGLMYSISLIDRTNLGLALVAGLQEDLALHIGNRYTVIVMVFFVAYILFEIPSNLILPRAGPANWLAFLGVGFGSVLLGMGFTKHWGTMALCRALLGVLEAGFLPGCTYLITCWYTRFEVGKRLSGFWIMSVILSAFSAIFAYVLALLDGKGGLAGWSWIFIIEGAITIVVCGLGWFIIIDFPTKAGKFLKPAEQAFVIERINNDRGDAEEDGVNARKILKHLKDWKLYFWAFNLMSSTLPGYAYSYFLPIILRNGMGFSRTNSMLLSAPPYLLAAIMAFVSGWLGDKYKIRGPIIAVHQAITAVGMLITVYAKSNAARYFGAFLGIGFLQFCVPGVLTFQANNITSHSKRAVASATCLIGGGVGGIISSVAFMAKESPHYTTGVWTTFGISMTSICMIIIMDLYFWRLNKGVKAGTRLNEGMAGWFYTL
ncbi:hypothetical protein VD0002_g4458 [Verticillium dahliae]|nr:hypothetical protein VD0003_g5870 [Verticillium dahliae]PNH64088.1 hypothetical protein VD0002_g4458 [Verticillium dahliae]